MLWWWRSESAVPVACKIKLLLRCLSVCLVDLEPGFPCPWLAAVVVKAVAPLVGGSSVAHLGCSLLGKVVNGDGAFFFVKSWVVLVGPWQVALPDEPAILHDPLVVGFSQDERSILEMPSRR